MTFIYKIVDNTNGNTYVGSCNNISKRKSKHKINKDCSSKIIIDNDNWDFIIIEECDESIRYEREQHYINTLDNVINQRQAKIFDYNNYNRNHYHNNKDKYKEYDARYRKKHHDKILLKEQLWRDNNKDAIKRKNKNWNDKNRDKIKSRNDYIASWGGRPQSNNNLLYIDFNLFL
jgi:hypothetical protein